MRIDRYVAVLVAVVAAVDTGAAVAQCTQGYAGDQARPFFGNSELGVGMTVTIYGDSKAQGSAGLQQTVTNAAAAWNKACPTSGYPNVPTFAINWSQSPPSSSNTGRVSIEVVYDTTDSMPTENGQFIPSLFQPGATAAATNQIVLYTKCPPASSKVQIPQIGCTNGATAADWTLPSAQTFVEHEIGHGLALADISNAACNSVMNSPPSANAAITLVDCLEIENLNDPNSRCNNQTSTDSTVNPCDAASKPPGVGGGPRNQSSGIGGNFCDEYSWICANGGGPSSWAGGGIGCNYGCSAVTDGQGNVVSTGCSWGCFAVDSTSPPPYGIGGPLLSVASPAANQTVSGVINISGWAMQYFGNALVSVGVDGTQESVSLKQGVASPQACAFPYGVVNYWCNANSGFSGVFDTRTLANGPHTLNAVAFSLAGWPTSVDVPFVTANTCFDTQPPTVSVASPAAGAAVNGVVSVTVAAADNVAVGQASLYVDGQIVAVWSAPPYVYSWNTSSLAAGVHTLQARAADTCANTAASPVVSVTVGLAPVRLYIDVPAPNGTVSGLGFTAVGWATDPYEIISLAFAMDGQSLPLTAPYTYGRTRADVCNAYPGDPNCPNVGWGATFDSTAYSNGSHTFSVTAIDGINQQGTANWPVVITNTPPSGTTSTVSWIEPELTAGFGPPGSMIVGGLAAGGLAGAGVHLWWRDVTAGGAWSLAPYAPAPVNDVWYNDIPSVNVQHVYAVYTVFSGVTTAVCTYAGNNTVNTCP
jgi:hypothetical protein